VGRDTDQADGPDGQQRQRHPVVAAVDLVAGGRGGDQAGRLGRVAGRILDPHDVVDLVGEAHEQGRGDLASGADGDVVDDHGQVGGLGDGTQVGLDPGL
jgi:hypothetical protein